MLQANVRRLPVDKEVGFEFPIGYKKPPLQTRFKPGQSGNPSGRPKKKATTLPECFERELNTVITVNEGGKHRRIRKVQAIAKQLTNKAVTGDHKATALLMRAVEPRELDPLDSLSPLLHEMRAIHAKHEATNPKGARASNTFRSGRKSNKR